MPKVEFSDPFCKSAKVISGRQTEYFDTLVRGLSLIASAGGSKTFYLHFTSPANGKRARIKLGTYPDITLAKARKRAKDTRVEVGDGADPAAEKRALEASQSVSDMVENYITRHASTKRSGKAIARRLRKNVKDVIGDVKLSALHRRDLTRCIDTVKDRGAEIEANRVFEDLRAMVRWARGRGDLDQNFMEGMKRPTETEPADRVLTADEIRTMWAALQAADMWEGSRRILRLCLVTGQRVGEVAGMTRDEIDLENRALWIIPAERSKNGREHQVPLSPMAIGIIREQLEAVKALAKRKERAVPPFIFPGPGGRASTTAAAISKAVKRQEVEAKGSSGPLILGVAPWTPHDLRRSAATHMEELGVSPFIVGHVLNHVSETKASVTSRVYARYDYAKEKRDSLDLWAGRLASILEGLSAEWRREGSPALGTKNN